MQKVNRTKEGELISIVIPVYNAEAYLKNCLDSIISQTSVSYTHLDVYKRQGLYGNTRLMSFRSFGMC